MSMHHTLTSPIQNRKCVYYECKAEELVDKNDSKVWEYRYTDTRAVDFVLVDPSVPNAVAFCPFSKMKAAMHIKSDGIVLQQKPTEGKSASFLVCSLY